ncbi:MAG TPA: hypothetical protein VFJ97_06230 [Dermatophilaceae bacterium]|nr:hypothetical protein [Dermatophilaceae bacterium]
MFEEVCARQLQHPGVTMGRALSQPGLMTGGKLFAFLLPDGRFVVKVPAARMAELVATGVGAPMTMGRRTMRQWVAVAGREPEWDGLADEARLYVESLAARPARGR